MTAPSRELAIPDLGKTSFRVSRESRGVLLGWGVRTDTFVNVVCRPLKR